MLNFKLIISILYNNLSKNEIHPFTIGRKNWLFSDTPKGAESRSIIYSIVECAKANGLNIYQYLVHLLERRPSFEMTDKDQLCYEVRVKRSHSIKQVRATLKGYRGIIERLPQKLLCFTVIYPNTWGPVKLKEPDLVQ